MIWYATEEMLRTGQTITSSALVQKKIEEEDRMDLGLPVIRKVLRREMNMGYRRARGVPV